jgi:hypothetical protein
MSRPTCTPPNSELLRDLAEQIRRGEQGRGDDPARGVTSGHPALDQLLPGQALCRGTLVEWLSAAGGSGAGTLALIAAREACREGGALIVVDRRRWFYPPAAAGLGIDLKGLIVVRPTSERDESWAIDQALRCPGVGAVWCWREKLHDRVFRRWQLAAESGGVLGLLVRPESARSEPSWAELRLLVAPLPSSPGPGAVRRLRVELLRCRGGLRRVSPSARIQGAQSGAAVELELEALEEAPLAMGTQRARRSQQAG